MEAYHSSYKLTRDDIYVIRHIRACLHRLRVLMETNWLKWTFGDKLIQMLYLVYNLYFRLINVQQ